MDQADLRMQELKKRRCVVMGTRVLATFTMLSFCLQPLQAQAQSLPNLVNEALESHPSIRAQRSLERASENGVDAARWQYFPKPSISSEQVGTSARDASYGNGGSRVTTLRLEQPIWTGGRLKAGVEKAEADVAVSKSSLEAVREDLALKVVQLYADWYGAYLKSIAYRKSLDVHLRLQDQIVRRIGQGISAASDLTLVGGREQQTEAELAFAEAQQATALARLAQLLGRSVSNGELLGEFSEPVALAVPVGVLIEQAKATNPDVVRLLAQARIHEAEIAERRADRLPEVYLRVERQYGSFVSQHADPQNRVFVGIATKFGAGLSTLSNERAAQDRYEAALASVESAKVGLGEQIASDYRQVESGQKRIALLLQSMASSETLWEAWGRQFLAGRKTWLDVMNAARELAQVEVQIAEAKASLLLFIWRVRVVARGVETTLLELSVRSLP